VLDKNYLLPQEALNLIEKSLLEFPLSVETIMLEDSYDRVLASDIVANEDLPSFDRSTVDGYAVKSSDTYGAKETFPVYFTLVGEVFMGLAPDFEVRDLEAAKIPTGGMLPTGTDSVVMLEYVQPVSDNILEIMRAVSPGENVIRRGEDIKKGSLLLKRGHKLRPQDVGALAGLGITSVDVYKRPVVAIISTGDEIVSPDSDLKIGQVRDINSYTLSGLIAETGGIPIKKGIFKDKYEIIKKVIEESLQNSDMILISGGTSAGTKDMTADIINDIAEYYGGEGVIFHGVSIKPGKPTIGGIIAGKPVFGLPGHPAAIFVCFDNFIKPILKRLCGLDKKENFIKSLKAKMAKNISSVSGREDHIRVKVEKEGEEFYAHPILGKSGLITTLVDADGIVIIPPNKLGINAGEEVTVRLF
jgi:molybdopterin molybdotransferase